MGKEGRRMGKSRRGGAAIQEKEMTKFRRLEAKDEDGFTAQVGVPLLAREEGRKGREECEERKQRRRRRRRRRSADTLSRRSQRKLGTWRLRR